MRSQLRTARSRPVSHRRSVSSVSRSGWPTGRSSRSCSVWPWSTTGGSRVRYSCFHLASPLRPTQVCWQDWLSDSEVCLYAHFVLRVRFRRGRSCGTSTRTTGHDRLPDDRSGAEVGVSGRANRTEGRAVNAGIPGKAQGRVGTRDANGVGACVPHLHCETEWPGRRIRGHRRRNRQSEPVHADSGDDARLQGQRRRGDGVSRASWRRDHAKAISGAVQRKEILRHVTAQSRHRRNHGGDIVITGYESRRAQSTLGPGARLQMTRAVVAATVALVAGLVTAQTWARGAGVHAVRYLMGTWCDLVIFDPQPRGDVTESVFQEIVRLEHVLSSWDSSSELSQLNAHAGHGPQTVSDDLANVVEESQSMCGMTGGAFDASVAPL